MTLVNWIITGVIAWIVAGTLAGILIGRIVRGREQQIPSPNHPTMRDQRPVCDHGHPQTERWSGKDVDECWYGHPITTGVATCTCPGSGREPGRPLNPGETAALDQLREQLR